MLHCVVVGVVTIFSEVIKDTVQVEEGGSKKQRGHGDVYNPTTLIPHPIHSPNQEKEEVKKTPSLIEKMMMMSKKKEEEKKG